MPDIVLPQLTLTVSAAVNMFALLRAEMESNEGRRVLENGTVKLDTVPSVRGADHHMDGSLVIVIYKAAHRATDRAVREASEAVNLMSLPRQLYIGKLIDIMRGADRTVYFKVRSITRRDEGSHQPAFRSFNPSKGQLIEMVINPHEESIQTASARAQTQAPATPATPVTPVTPVDPSQAVVDGDPDRREES